MAQLVEQERAAYALKKITEAKGAPIKQSELKAYASSLPSLILKNGLGQAMAFAKSKSDSKGKGLSWDLLYKMLEEWLKKPGQPYAGKSLLEGITSTDQSVYRQAQAEALALLVWIRRFARSELES